MKLSPMKPRDFISKIEKLGWERCNKQSGTDHMKYKNPETNITVEVPWHAKGIKVGSICMILRRMGVDKKVFLNIN